MHGEKTKEKFKITPFGVVLFIILALYAASVIYIYVWAFLNSFKTSGDFTTICSAFRKSGCSNTTSTLSST